MCYCIHWGWNMRLLKLRLWLIWVLDKSNIQVQQMDWGIFIWVTADCSESNVLQYVCSPCALINDFVHYFILRSICRFVCHIYLSRTYSLKGQVTNVLQLTSFFSRESKRLKSTFPQGPVFHFHMQPQNFLFSTCILTSVCCVFQDVFCKDVLQEVNPVKEMLASTTVFMHNADLL